MSDTQEAIQEDKINSTVTDLDVNSSHTYHQAERKNSKSSDKSEGKKSNKSDKSEGKKSNKSDKSEGKKSNKSDKSEGKKSNKSDKKKDGDDKKSEKSEKEDDEHAKSHDHEVIQETKRESDEIKSKRTEIDASNQETTAKSTKKKGFISNLLSCGFFKGMRKQKITIDIGNACEVFDARITSDNGFIAGALCNLQDGENYAHMPSKFKLNHDEITALKSNAETYNFNGETFTRIRLNDQKSIFGTCDSDKSLNISIKHNSKLLLVATWKNDDHQCARIFTESYDDILKNNKVNE